ncbi:sulfurtransferase TusA family protein, partial [Clostridium sp. WILCCON 0269]
MNKQFPMDLKEREVSVSLESNLNEYGEAAEAYKKGHFDKNIDACGLCCPGPLMRVNSDIQDMGEGEILKVTASDQGFYEDIKSWCERTHN